MSEDYKICKNPKCQKKFYRRRRETIHQWRNRLFCSRACQAATYLTKKRGKPVDGPLGSYNLNLMHDAARRCMDRSDKAIRDRVTIHSSKKMSQEELRKLVPSMQEDE